MEKIGLQDWAEENTPDDNMIFKSAYWDQVIFIRDHMRMFFADRTIEYSHDYAVNFVSVISTHTSKSIKLPVFYLKTNGIEFILRYNFYDWKISVKSEKELNYDFMNLFNPDASKFYCEGFSKEWIYKSFSEDKSKFTIELNPGYHTLYMFLYIISHNLKMNKVKKEIK